MAESKTTRYLVEMTPEHVWSASDVVASQINKFRKRAELNREQLAARCQELGAPASLSAAAIANIETGRRTTTGQRRRDVTIDELLLFAHALDVPPLLLVYPVDDEVLHEVVPGRELPVWMAAKWFTGEGPLGVRSAEDGRWYVDTDEFERWNRNVPPVELRREHDHLVAAWNTARSAAELHRATADAASTNTVREAELHEADQREREVRAIEDNLRHLRREMPRYGLTPPEMNEALRHIHEEPRR